MWRVPVHRPTVSVLGTIHQWYITLYNAGTRDPVILAREKEQLEDVVKQRDNLLQFIATVQPLDWQVFQSAMRQSGLIAPSVTTAFSKSPYDFIRLVLAPLSKDKLGSDHIIATLFKPENTWAILRYLEEVLKREGIAKDGTDTTAISPHEEVH